MAAACLPVHAAIEWNTDLARYQPRTDGLNITAVIATRDSSKNPEVAFKVCAKQPLKDTHTNWRIDLKGMSASEAELGMDNPIRKNSIDWPIGRKFWTLKGEDIDKGSGFLKWEPKHPLPIVWTSVEFSADLKTNTLYCAVDGIPVGILGTGIKHLEEYHPSICFRGGGSSNSNTLQKATLQSSPMPITPNIQDFSVSTPHKKTGKALVTQSH